MESNLEMTILRNLIEQKGVQAVEAGGALAPAQSAFCAKICSKIITSQFCIVLLNNEEEAGREIPNANVNMEYGLMLGFNKYIIPFQRESQKLPFNVAGLDTIKYTSMNVERLARDAIDQAIEVTQQDTSQPINPDQVISVFLLSKKALFNRLNTQGDRDIYQLGEPLGFNLLNDFSGFGYIFFGNITFLRAENVIWRLQMLKDILSERIKTIPNRIELGLIKPELAQVWQEFIDRLEIWIVVTSDENKSKILEILAGAPLGYSIQIFSLDDVKSELDALTKKMGESQPES